MPCLCLSFPCLKRKDERKSPRTSIDNPGFDCLPQLLCRVPTRPTQTPLQSTMPRRGVVVSDDEDSTPSSRQPRQSTSRSGPRKEVLRPSAATDVEVPNLPSVAKLSPEEVQQLGLLCSDRRNLRQHIIAAMAIISDAAVAVEELKTSAENSRVF